MTPRSSQRSVLVARKIRLFTALTDVFSVSATSRYDMPSTRPSKKAVRWFNGS